MTHPHASTTATRTVRELLQALTRLADSGELPRGLNTPVEVGIVLDADTFDASAAFSVEPVTATWPGFRPSGAVRRHTTVALIGDRGHPDADRYTRHEPGPTGHPDWEDPPATDPPAISERRAEPGERCTCGRQAVVVFHTDTFGETGWCGRADGGEQTGPCPFCGGQRHQGRCPAYRLRPDPP
jgi:hypothetical protein